MRTATFIFGPIKLNFEHCVKLNSKMLLLFTHFTVYCCPKKLQKIAHKYDQKAITIVAIAGILAI